MTLSWWRALLTSDARLLKMCNVYHNLLVGLGSCSPVCREASNLMVQALQYVLLPVEVATIKR